VQAVTASGATARRLRTGVDKLAGGALHHTYGILEGAVDADVPESKGAQPVTYVSHGGTETRRLLKEIPCLRASVV